MSRIKELLLTSEAAFNSAAVGDSNPLDGFDDYDSCSDRVASDASIAGFFFCTRPLHDTGQHVAVGRSRDGVERVLAVAPLAA